MPKHIIPISIACALLFSCNRDKDVDDDDDRTGAQGTPSSNLPANTRPTGEPGQSHREMNPGSMRTPPEPGGAGQPGSNDKPDPMLGGTAPRAPGANDSASTRPTPSTAPSASGGRTPREPGSDAKPEEPRTPGS